MTTKKRAMSRPVDGLVRPAVVPHGMATPYLSPRDAPYRIVFRKDWAYVYKGRKRVWSCNPDFAMAHFADMPNKEMSGGR